jgi:hypothetical protein
MSRGKNEDFARPEDSRASKIKKGDPDSTYFTIKNAIERGLVIPCRPQAGFLVCIPAGTDKSAYNSKLVISYPNNKDGTEKFRAIVKRGKRYVPLKAEGNLKKSLEQGCVGLRYATEEEKKARMTETDLQPKSFTTEGDEELDEELEEELDKEIEEGLEALFPKPASGGGGNKLKIAAFVAALGGGAYAALQNCIVPAAAAAALGATHCSAPSSFFG